jgi:hypothetical protein
VYALLRRSKKNIYKNGLSDASFFHLESKYFIKISENHIDAVVTAKINPYYKHTFWQIFFLSKNSAATIW